MKSAYPNHLRLSIHQSTGEHKISLSLLNTNTGFTTPWHCSVALMATGEWLSAPKGDFETDPKFRVVDENGRPSYFQEQKIEADSVSDGEPTLVAGATGEGTTRDDAFYPQVTAAKSSPKSSEDVSISEPSNAESSEDSRLKGVADDHQLPADRSKSKFCTRVASSDDY